MLNLQPPVKRKEQAMKQKDIDNISLHLDLLLLQFIWFVPPYMHLFHFLYKLKPRNKFSTYGMATEFFLGSKNKRGGIVVLLPDNLYCLKRGRQNRVLTISLFCHELYVFVSLPQKLYKANRGLFPVTYLHVFKINII